MKTRVLPVLALAVTPLIVVPEAARAQGAVAFAPVVVPFPNGISMGVTPVVSADRRYVRLGVQPQFVALTGIETYTIPAAVRGGVGNGGIGGLGGAGIGGAGFPSVGLGPNMGPGYQLPRFEPSFQDDPAPGMVPPSRPKASAKPNAKTKAKMKSKGRSGRR
jgi:hypothetical protein